MKAQRQRRRMIAGGALASLGVLMVVIGAINTSGYAGPPDPADFSISFLDRSVVGGGTQTQFRWTLSGPEGEDVSHVVIQTCLVGTAAATNGASYEDPDGHGHTGYKWDDNPEVGSIFSLTFNGVIPDGGTASWWIKKGPGFSNGTSNGPSCGGTTTTTEATTTTTEGEETSTTTEGEETSTTTEGQATTTTTEATTTTTTAGLTTTTGATTTTVALTTTTAVVLGVVETPSTAAAPAAPTTTTTKVAVEGETARAVPSELAFTGSGDPPWLTMTLGGVFVLAGAALLVSAHRSARNA